MRTSQYCQKTIHPLPPAKSKGTQVCGRCNDDDFERRGVHGNAEGGAETPGKCRFGFVHQSATSANSCPSSLHHRVFSCTPASSSDPVMNSDATFRHQDKGSILSQRPNGRVPGLLLRGSVLFCAVQSWTQCPSLSASAGHRYR